MKPHGPLRVLILVAALAITACAKGGDVTNPPQSTTTPIAFSGGSIDAEIAATSAARETGLMNRSALGTNAGMLFVFALDQEPLISGFWMKGTSVALSIAFLDNARRVLAVQDMTPFDTVTIHRPASPYRYALEVNRGWFAAHGVTAGATATFTLPAGTVITP